MSLSPITTPSLGMPNVSASQWPLGATTLGHADIEAVGIPGPSGFVVPHQGPGQGLGILPSRPIYDYNQTYWKFRPWLRAVPQLLMPGDRSDKFTNFVSELGASVAYQKGLQGLSNLTNDAYQRDSKLAEWMNRHATLTYLGFAILAPIVASPIYGVVRPGLNWLFGRPVVRQGVDSVTQSKAADTILGPIERGASRLGHNLRQAYQRSPGLQGLAKFSIVGVGLAAVGAFVWTLVRLVQDTGRFGHHYGLARQTDRDSSPYALRQQVLQRLY